MYSISLSILSILSILFSTCSTKSLDFIDIAPYIIQPLGRRDLSGCFLVHICAFCSSYSSYFAFLCTSTKIFRAKMGPTL